MRIRTTFIAFALVITVPSLAQNYDGFNYQAVIRNAAGDPLPNQAVGVRVQINPGIAAGYSETHSVTTDARGIINLVIGQGTPEVGSVIPTFSALDWTGSVMNYTVSVDITGGTDYAVLGDAVFKAVPFAMHALSSGSGGSGWSLLGNDLSNTNTGNVGIGTTVPESALDLHGGNLRVTGDGSSAAMDLTPFSPSGNDPGARVQATDDGGFGAHLDFFAKPIGDITNTLQHRMRIQSDGLVGIGTTAPESALDLHGGNLRVTGDGLSAALDLTPFSPSGNDPGARVQASDDGGFGAHLDFFVKPIGSLTNTLENRMRIESNGNVGIGTTTPESMLQVGSYGGAVDRYITVASQGGNTQRSGIKLRHFNTSYGYTIESDERIASEGFHILEHFANPTGTSVMYIQKFSGNVGIGTTTPQSKLAVNGRITCKEVEVSLVGFPDYVFAKDYRLMPLAEVERYIAANGHLPNVPSACEVEENGLGLGELNKILLEKVEELTLHLIEKDQEVDALQREVRQLRGMILELHAK
ncbi:MAG TPA: hypothetical protein PKE21_17235 [Flavobacteriales bacterium]|nr:hypothetical protein [Flavobacteriales bacterium]HMR29224.1 hypothetical protein [Flavobacteriales bacterium]